MTFTYLDVNNKLMDFMVSIIGYIFLSVLIGYMFLSLDIYILSQDICFCNLMYSLQYSKSTTNWILSKVSDDMRDLTFLWLTQIIMKFDTSYHTHVLQTNIYWEASLLNQPETITFSTFPE